MGACKWPFLDHGWNQQFYVGEIWRHTREIKALISHDYQISRVTYGSMQNIENVTFLVCWCSFQFRKLMRTNLGKKSNRIELMRTPSNSSWQLLTYKPFFFFFSKQVVYQLSVWHDLHPDFLSALRFETNQVHIEAPKMFHNDLVIGSKRVVI